MFFPFQGQDAAAFIFSAAPITRRHSNSNAKQCLQFIYCLTISVTYRFLLFIYIFWDCNKGWGVYFPLYTFGDIKYGFIIHITLLSCDFRLLQSNYTLFTHLYESKHTGGGRYASAAIAANSLVTGCRIDYGTHMATVTVHALMRQAVAAVRERPPRSRAAFRKLDFMWSDPLIS